MDFYNVLLVFLLNMHGFSLSKIKKALQLLTLFKTFLEEPNKKWVGKGSKFYDKSMK